MFKLIILVKRKAGMSVQDFKQYYESTHVTLATRLMPPADCYRRNYVLRDDPFIMKINSHTQGNDADSFDAITEIVYSTRETAESMLQVLSTTENGSRIVEDEAKFCDRDRMRMFVVEVCQSAMPWQPG